MVAPRLLRAYDGYCAGDGGQALRQALPEGATHWQSVCQQVLALYRAHGAAAQPHIRTLLEASASQLA